MALGSATAAPLGYLRFCARRPDQCGLDAPTAANGAPVDPDQRAKALFARYYWSMAFQGAAPADLRLTPTSGPAAQSAAPQPGALGGYKWSAVFGNWSTIFAPSAPSAPTASRPAPTPATIFASSAGPPAVAASANPPKQEEETERAAPVAIPDPLATTPALLARLDGVNLRINRAIRYVADEQQYGAADYWTLPLEAGGPAAGDCKDYVLEKRRALVAAGLPAGDLSIAIVRTWRGETHAVLLVSTDKGELVLDSLSSWIRPWRDVGYTWIERQAPGQQLVWVTIGAEAT
jgi:predicted transglutaminase-like cysteine proteinase